MDNKSDTAPDISLDRATIELIELLFPGTITGRADGSLAWTTADGEVTVIAEAEDGS